jgi:hypothetical protein
LQSDENQLLGLLISKETQEIGTHMIIGEKETYPIRIIEELEDVSRRCSLVAKAARSP